MRDLEAGELLPVADTIVTVVQGVPKGHKIAVASISAGAPVIKYGFPIGRATVDIAAGEHVHSHNVATALATNGDYAYRPVFDPRALDADPGSFDGYLRADGRAGTRNEIWVIPTVGCVARTATKIAERATRLHGDRVDGIHALTYPFCCSQLGDDLNGTRALLAALAQHPNAGGVLLVGLGCESNQLEQLLACIDPEARSHVRTLRAQSAGDEVEEGLALVAELVALAARAASRVSRRTRSSAA